MSVYTTTAFMSRTETSPLSLDSFKQLVQKFIQDYSYLHVWDKGEPSIFYYFNDENTISYYSGKKQIFAEIDKAYESKQGVHIDFDSVFYIYSFPHAVTITHHDGDYIWGQRHYFAVTSVHSRSTRNDIELLDTLKEFWGALDYFVISIG